MNLWWDGRGVGELGLGGTSHWPVLAGDPPASARARRVASGKIHASPASGKLPLATARLAVPPRPMRPAQPLPRAGVSPNFIRKFICTTTVMLGLLFLVGAAEAGPRHVYLTWQGDSSRTMTVNYQTLGASGASTVYYDTKPQGGRPEAYRRMAVGRWHQVPGLEDGRKVHWVELEQLEPGQTYYFIAGDASSGFTAERKFRTVPAGSEKLRFVTGGDMGVSADLVALLQQAAKLSPAFGLVGGDIAYANDAVTNYARWDAWLDHWQTNMITPAGHTIPMVLAIGNHEVRGGMTPTNARFYLRYFAQAGERSYHARTFGKNLALLMLDSGHLATHEGEQAEWLDAQLAAHRNVPHRMAVYHVPMYPSVRVFDGSGSTNARNAWLPLFDKHRLTVAFENHDHAFKRTPLLRGNQIDPAGTLYLGDGCWGMPARPVKAERRWYETKAASIQHFWCVDVTSRRVEYRAVDKGGQVFDVYPPDAAGAKEADKTYETLIQKQP